MAETVGTTPSAPRAADTASRPPRALQVVGILAGVVLGGVFLFAAWAKAIDPAAFVADVQARGLGVLGGAAPVAYLALALEAGLGTLLLLGVRRLWVLVPAALLVAFFLSLTGQDYYRAAHGLEPASASCGCFGNLVVRSPAQAFWQDLLLLVPPLVLAFLGRCPRARRLPPARTAAGLVVAAAAVLLAWKAPELPLDDWATRLSPGVHVSTLCAGQGSDRICLDSVVPELDHGEHLVILAALDEPFGKKVARINGYLDRQAFDPDAPPVFVVTTAERATQQAFFWQWGPGFEIREAPEPLVKPLVRRLPRSFLVEDGEVRETWDGLPPFDRWTAAGGGAQAAGQAE